MNAKEQFQSDLKKIKVLLEKETPNSDGWWKIKELRSQCQISWGQSANIASEWSANLLVLEEKHTALYQYLTAPYREWIDSKTNDKKV